MNATQSRASRRNRASLRAKWNARPQAELFDRAAAVFLRLAVLAGTRPVPGKAPHHHFQMAHTLGGPVANPSLVYSVTRELYGEQIGGIEQAKPALDLLRMMAGDSGTTDFPTIKPNQIRVGYHLAKAAANALRKEESERALNAAFAQAASRVAWFFAWLGAGVRA